MLHSDLPLHESHPTVKLESSKGHLPPNNTYYRFNFVVCVLLILLQTYFLFDLRLLIIDSLVLKLDGPASHAITIT